MDNNAVPAKFFQQLPGHGVGDRLGVDGRGGAALIADDRAHVALHHFAQGLEHRLLQAVAGGRAVIFLDEVEPVDGQIDRLAPGEVGGGHEIQRPVLIEPGRGCGGD